MSEFKHILIAILVLLCVFMTACGGSKKAANADIVGTWHHKEKDYEATYTFNEDYTYTELLEAKGGNTEPVNLKGTYECEKGTLKLTAADGGQTYSYGYEIEGDKMTWSKENNSRIEYTRQ